MYDDDRDALAAEYVLGTLSADDRDQAEALLAIDPGFAEMVHQWERRLGELNVMVEAVEPPPEVWEKLHAEIGGGDQPGEVANEVQLPAIGEAVPQTAPETPLEMPSQPAPDLIPQPTQDFDEPSPRQDFDDGAALAALASSLLPTEPGLDTRKPPPEPPPPAAPKIERTVEVIHLALAAKRWRRLTLLAGAIAALLAIYVGVEQFAPDLITLPRSPQMAVASRPLPSAPRYVAVLQHDPTGPAFLLAVDPQSRTLTVRRVAASAEANRSYELWLISSKYPNPRSLGVVGGEEFTARPIPAGFDGATLREASYAISLEPAGGSPSGVPTGPILFTGKLVEAVPPSPT